MKSILETNGYSVQTSSDWCSTLAILKQNSIDVVIVDYEMPGMSGFEAALRIRTICPEAPIILHSDSLLPDLASKRIDACIPKGTDPAVMLAAVSGLMMKARPRHAGSVVCMEEKMNAQGQKIEQPIALAIVAQGGHGKYASGKIISRASRDTFRFACVCKLRFQPRPQIYHFVLASPIEKQLCCGGIQGCACVRSLTTRGSQRLASGMSRFQGEISRKMILDRSVTARSNGTSAFVCNKTSIPGGGLAEGRRQRVAKSAIIAIGKISPNC